MDYNNQDLDFIIRTKKIRTQYNEYIKDISEHNKFEITLFLNCFIGLLFIGKEKNNLEIIHQEDLFGLPIEDIKKSKNRKGEDDNSLSCIIFHLRNSIAHYKFIGVPDDENKIYKIRFRDCSNRNCLLCSDFGSEGGECKTFEAEFSIKDINNFLEKFSANVIEILKQKSQK